MKYKTPFIVIIFVLTVSLVTGENTDNTSLKGLEQIIGKWRSQSGDSVFNERWQRLDKHTLTSRSEMKNSKTGKVAFYESGRIQTMGQYIILIVSPNDGRPVLFTLIENKKEAGKQVWTFENKEHDFPQRIIYTLLSKDTLTATVEGKLKGKDAKDQFHMKRVK